MLSYYADVLLFVNSCPPLFCKWAKRSLTALKFLEYYTVKGVYKVYTSPALKEELMRQRK
ncbi:MAG TPA: hypothetical protein DEP01_04270 [Aminobacterium sp.]|jgi:hypothetical protein|nr:hypothetical protein [Aminobacterium sp.]